MDYHFKKIKEKHPEADKKTVRNTIQYLYESGYASSTTHSHHEIYAYYKAQMYKGVKVAVIECSEKFGISKDYVYKIKRKFE